MRSIPLAGNVAFGSDMGPMLLGGGGRGNKRRKKRGRRRGGGAYPTVMRRELFFDMDHLAMARQMYNKVPGFKFARQAMQSRIFCMPFHVTFKNWPVASTEEGGNGGSGDKTFGDDAQEVVKRYWMPALKEIYDLKETWGFCPYTWEHIEGTRHYYPKVPPWGTYLLTYEEDRFGREFRLYWIDGARPEEATDVFWVRSDQEPEQGVLRTAVASLLPEYELYLTNISSTNDAIVNAANPYHVFEYHPKVTSDLAEIQDTSLSFSPHAAMSVLQDTEGVREARETIRRDHLQAALRHSHALNYGVGWQGASDGSADEEVAQRDLLRTHAKFLQRSTMLSADYYYKPAAQSKLILSMPDIWKKLNNDAANALGFPLEFAQAQSAQRSANVQGNIRYINENVKSALNEYTRIVQRMFVVSPYGRIINKLNKLRKEVAAAENASRREPNNNNNNNDFDDGKGQSSVIRKARARDGVSPRPPQPEVVKDRSAMQVFRRVRNKSDDGKKKKSGLQKRDADGTDRLPSVGAVREPTARLEYELRRDVQVDIEFACVPEMSYEQVRELVLDGVLPHNEFIKLSGDMFGLPRSMLSDHEKNTGLLMEQEQMQIARKDAKEKWKHQDEALKWHEMRAKAIQKSAGQQGGDGGGSSNLQLPPTAKSAAMTPPSRAMPPSKIPARRRASTTADQ